jgi:hypothetical protein
VELLLPEIDPALAGLSPDDYTRISELADEVVRMYGGTGPPFPILHLLAILEPVTLILPPLDDGLDAGVYGYAFPVEFARYKRHAALCLDSNAPTREVFVTAFHEAGHVLLHILPDRCAPGIPYARRAGPPLDPRHGQAEIEADLFARLTTMPAAWVRPAWLYAAAVTATPDEAVAWMADLFSVPVGWMQRRLLHLGLL